jgi:hypothetical protein
MIKLKQSDSLGPSMFCVKLFKTLGGNAAAVAGIINDLYARGIELSREERVQFLLWFIEQETKLDEVTFDYIFRRLPKSLTQKYARGGLRAVRDLLPDQDGNESLTA